MRIASLQPSVSLTLAHLEALDTLCAVTKYCVAAVPGLSERNLRVIHDSWTFSQADQQTLVEAYRKGTQFRVIVVDSRPLFEGKHLARALADLGLEVQYSLTHAIDHVMKEATKVFLGAHAMMSKWTDQRSRITLQIA